MIENDKKCSECIAQPVCRLGIYPADYECAKVAKRLEAALMPILSRSKLIDRLSDMYHTDCLAVADCCDKVLDRSGALLGEVREHHGKIYGAVDTFAQ